MTLWTFITDYDGGTYISQYEAESIADAFRLAHQKNDKFLKRVGRDDFMDPTPIKSVANVFYVSTLYKKKLVSVNIILTVP